MALVFSVINQKGGVGKTTTAVNLAAALAALSQRVLVVDMDPQFNASAMLNVRAADSVFQALTDGKETPFESIIVETPVPGVWLAPSNKRLAALDAATINEPGREMRLKEALKPLASGFDAVIIDTAPSLALPSSMALVASDVALIAFKCESLSTEGLAQISETLDVVQQRYSPGLRRRIVLTMLDGRTFHGPALESALRAKFGALVCDTAIPQSADLARAIDNRDVGGSVLKYAPNCNAAEAFRKLALELLPQKDSR